MNRNILKNTMQPVLKTRDIMNKFNISRGAALKLMQNESLHAYYVGKSLVVEQQYFDDFLNSMIDCGGSVTMSMVIGPSPKLDAYRRSKKSAFEFVMDVLNDEELENFCDAVFNNEN